MISATLVYLNETNYWFDQKLKRLANPLLREVMEVGHYRVSEQDTRSMFGG